jgi:hypothetical protein
MKLICLKENNRRSAGEPVRRRFMVVRKASSVVGLCIVLFAFFSCASSPKPTADPQEERLPSIYYNRRVFSKLEGFLYIAASGPLISGKDGRYVAFLDFEKCELEPVFLKGVRRDFAPWAVSPSRGKVYFSCEYEPPVINGEPSVPTFFGSVCRIGEYDTATKSIRFLFEGPFESSGFEYSGRDDAIFFAGTRWAEPHNREHPFRDTVFKLDAASGKVREIINSTATFNVEDVAEGGRVLLLMEREEVFSETRYFIRDFEGRRLNEVRVSYEDGILLYPRLSRDGKSIAFVIGSGGGKEDLFFVERCERDGVDIIFIRGKWSGKHHRWFRGLYCFSPDGRYLILLFAKRPWPCKYSEVTLVLYDLDTGEYDWLVKAEYAPTSLYLNWQQ